ncbi:MAG: VWA domain-containing protein, partial [Elusimicrobia bacterium]|nr:VWA domain-containing protein [Elusimicrobiota bacterium]
AGPQWGVDLVRTTASARQVVVAVDVSLSMQTPDVVPTRLERAKSSLSLLLDQLKGDRVGVVAFAGDAQVVCPLTDDVEAAKELLGALEVGAIPTPGTAIGSAIRTAASMLGRYPGDKSVVLLTDGEDHRSHPLGAAREAAASGVRVFTVGIGTTEGEPIPIGGGGYKKDSQGRTVVSRLGETTLMQIARITGGTYYRTSPGEDEISDIAAKIQAGRAAGGIAGTAQRWHDRYAWPLGLAFLLLLVEMLLPLVPVPRPRGAAPAALALLALLAAPPRAGAAFFEGTLRDANKNYAQGRYEDALAGYGDASAARPSDPRPVFNAGDALYRLDRDSEAAGAFASVAAREGAPIPLRASAFYNLGNARYRGGDYKGAADAYRRSLILSPDDAAARLNLAIALRSIRHPPPKDRGGKNKNQPPKPKPGGGKSSSGGGQNRPNQPPPRPQDRMSQEDADRVLRAVAQREKAAQQKAGSPLNDYGKERPKPPPNGDDW